MSLGSIAALTVLALSPQARFVRDQSHSTDLIPWGDRALILTEPPRVFDFATERSETLRFPEDQRFLGLAECGKRSFFLCASPCGEVKLLEVSGEGWKNHELPYARRIGDVTATAIAADQDTLVVFVSPWIYRLEAGEWKTVAVRKFAHDREGVLAPCPRPSLLMGQRLFLGYDDGEWGGDLVALDIDTGELIEIEGMGHGSETPVRGLTLDQRGRLWTARGLSHLGGSEGGLYRLDGDRWTVIAWNEGLHAFDEDENEEVQRAGDWNLPLTGFDGIAFGRDNTVYLLADHLGLLRQQPAGGWTRVTPGWAEHAYVHGLVLHGRTALVGAGDAGLLLVDLDDGSMRRVDPR